MIVQIDLNQRLTVLHPAMRKAGPT